MEGAFLQNVSPTSSRPLPDLGKWTRGLGSKLKHISCQCSQMASLCFLDHFVDFYLPTIVPQRWVVLLFFLFSCQHPIFCLIGDLVVDYPISELSEVQGSFSFFCSLNSSSFFAFSFFSSSSLEVPTFSSIFSFVIVLSSSGQKYGV